MSAAFDFAAMVDNTDHRDAGLLDLIEQFNQLQDASGALIRRARRFKEDGRAYRRFWKDALANRGEERRLEQAIIATKAQTRLGVIAKLNVWLGTQAENTGTMMDLPRAAIAEAKAMLGEVD